MASQVPKQGVLFVSYFFWNMFMSIRGSTRASAHFDLACAVSFNPTMLNLVAIRPYCYTCVHCSVLCSWFPYYNGYKFYHTHIIVLLYMYIHL